MGFRFLPCAGVKEAGWAEADEGPPAYRLILDPAPGGGGTAEEATPDNLRAFMAAMLAALRVGPQMRPFHHAPHFKGSMPRLHAMCRRSAAGWSCTRGQLHSRTLRRVANHPQVCQQCGAVWPSPDFLSAPKPKVSTSQCCTGWEEFQSDQCSTSAACTGA